MIVGIGGWIAVGGLALVITLMVLYCKYTNNDDDTDAFVYTPSFVIAAILSISIVFLIVGNVDNQQKMINRTVERNEIIQRKRLGVPKDRYKIKLTECDKEIRRAELNIRAFGFFGIK